MNILAHNRMAWDDRVAKGDRWTIPVSEEEINAARRGEIRIVLTPHKPIPDDWLSNVSGKKILCLASGGGQQGPVLAAAGGIVTVFDNSDRQLEKDIALSGQFDLGITTAKGNMQDLSVFEDDYFDMIVHPCSNCFIDDIRPVWCESARVTKSGGRLLSGFSNPILYMMDWEKADRTRECLIERRIPYSDLETLSEDEKARYVEEKVAFEFGHSLTDQIQGQIEAGFVISGFYEDSGEDLLDRFTDSFIATMATKL